AHPRRGRRLDRVHPQAGHRDPRLRHTGHRDRDRTRRGDRPRRPHPGDVPRPDRGNRAGGHPARAARPDDGRRHERSRHRERRSSGMTAAQTQAPVPPVPETTPGPSRWREAWTRVASGNALVSVLAVVAAVIVGSIMIALTDTDVQAAAGYFFQRPGDTFGAIGSAVGGAYAALFRGSIYNFNADTFAIGIRPFTETLKFATPLIAAGLGVGLAFRAGLFNIGGQGQMLMAAAAAGYVATTWDLPFPLHMLAALVAGLVADRKS